MKTKLSIGKIQVGEVKVENISLEHEYTAGDVVQLLGAGKNFVKEVIKDFPEMLEDIEKAYDVYDKIDAKQRNAKSEVKALSRDEMLNHLSKHLVAHISDSCNI